MHCTIKLCVCIGEFFLGGLTHYHHKTWNCQVVKYCVLSAIDGVAPMKQLSYSWIDRVPAIACTELGFPRILFDNWLKLAFLIYVPARYFTTGTLLSGSFLSEVLTASSYGKQWYSLQCGSCYSKQLTIRHHVLYILQRAIADRHCPFLEDKPFRHG